jgi:6-phosphogluconate dehydrogenase
MQIGMIGLGRMGASMARRLANQGHECVVHDADPAAVAGMRNDGFPAADSLADFAARLARPRTVWVMVPAGVVDRVLEQLAPHLEPGDTVIDGGNSYYRDDIARAARLGAAGIHYVDVGTSGGVAGLDRGYCLMIGGEPATVQRLEPIFRALAPGVAAAPRTPGRDGAVAGVEEGFLHCGPAGAGHFVKMVHNGIEYAMMAAYAEGFNILRHAGIGKKTFAADAETTPLRDPEAYQYAMNLPDIAEVWRRGSVIPSWLLDLTTRALLKSPQLDGFSGHVSDSGEGRWTILAAVEEGVPAQVLSAALYDRFSSRDNGLFANQMLSAMRKEFGGHAEQAKPAK